MRVSTGPVDAATGLRAVTMTLTNCGTEPHTAHGFPQLRLLDDQRRPVDVVVRHGAPGGIPNPAPSPITLQHGDTAQSVLSWRNTVTFGRPITAEHVAITPPGGRTQVVPLRVDTGTTGHVEVTAWHVEPPGQ